MNAAEGLAQQFEDHRTHLRAVAYRMLGSVSEADDAVQEAWIRLDRSDAAAVANLRGWLTTVVARVALDMLRARQSRREEPLDDPGPELPAQVPDPEHEAVLAESVGLAMLVVLDALNPAERIALVLHDMFGVPFDDIAVVLDRSPAAAKQLASRARRRVRGSTATDGDPARQRAVVDAFLAASRGGDFAALLALLDPDVAVRADPASVRAGAPAEVLGADAVARTFSGRAQAAQSALVEGLPGAVWAPGGRPRVVFRFTVVAGRVTAIEMLADPATVEQLELTLLDD